MARTWKRTLLGLALGLALYCLIGFFLLPYLLLQLSLRQLEQQATLPASIAQISFNPFTLELDVKGFRLGDEKEPVLVLDGLQADLAWNSVWRGALHLEQVQLRAPSALVKLDKQGKLNAQDWFVRTTTEEAPPAQSPFPLTIDQLTLEQGRLTFEDQRQDEPQTFVISALALGLKGLTTEGDALADGQLTAQGPAGSALQWQGRLGLTPLRSEGMAQVNTLDLPTFATYLKPLLPVSLEQGQLDFKTAYRLSLDKGLHAETSAGQLKLSDLLLNQADGQPLLRLASLAIDQIQANPQTRDLRIGHVHSQGLESWIERDPSGALNWQKALGAGQSAKAEKRTETSSWRVRLDQAQLQDHRLHLNDRLPAQAVALDVGPLEASLRRFDSQGQEPLDIQLKSPVGRHGNLAVEGQVSLSPLSAKLALRSQDLDLRLAQAYLAPYANLEIRSGLLSSDLEVDLRAVMPLDFDISGEVTVGQLHTRDTVRNRDLVRWRQLDVQALRYQHGKLLNIAGIELTAPYARFVINPDLSTNISELLKPQPAGSTPAPQKDGQELGIHIGRVKLRDGSAHFADLSLRPNFVTDIQMLNGEVGAIDNRAKAPATVRLAGKVDRYAPVRIEGHLAPFDPTKSLDLAARFQNLELTTLTPYAAKFAGYRIRKGRMNLGLHYRIVDQRLNAEHDIVIDELQLGERVDSPDAVDLPVRLAVALLKDSNGTINLAIPIEGDLENPEFDVMPLVWQTLRNLVVKAAKSPFTFIGGLVGAPDSDLSQVDFEPGSALLDDKARRGLAQLAAALKQRPQLRLDIEGAASAAIDGPSVARERLEQGLRTLWYQELQRQGERVPGDASQLQVPEQRRPALVARLYQRWIDPTGVQAAKLPEADRQEAMHAALIAHWASRETLLRRLGQARAAAIKVYLAEEQGLDDQRVFLLDARVTAADDKDPAPTRLHLGSE